jgi:hypothetical protein
MHLKVLQVYSPQQSYCVAVHQAADTTLVSEASRIYNAELEATVGIVAGMKSKSSNHCGF